MTRTPALALLLLAAACGDDRAAECRGAAGVCGGQLRDADGGGEPRGCREADASVVVVVAPARVYPTGVAVACEGCTGVAHGDEIHVTSAATRATVTIKPR